MAKAKSHVTHKSYCLIYREDGEIKKDWFNIKACDQTNAGGLQGEKLEYMLSIINRPGVDCILGAFRKEPAP